MNLANAISNVTWSFDTNDNIVVFTNGVQAGTNVHFDVLYGTNYIPMETNSASTSSQGTTLQNPAPNTAADIQKVFQDFGCQVSISSILFALLIVKAAASYYRNFALKNTVKGDVGPIQNGIAHFAGQSLPEVLPQAVPIASPFSLKNLPFIPHADELKASDLTTTPPSNPQKL